MSSCSSTPPQEVEDDRTDDEQRAAGVTPGLVRLSLGVEDIEDILADLERGFAAAARRGDDDAGERA